MSCANKHTSLAFPDWGHHFLNDLLMDLRLIF